MGDFNMSSALLWELTSTNNSFLRRRNGYNFSASPYSLTNRHLASDSGLGNNAVGVTSAPRVGDDGKRTFTFTVRRRRRWGKNQPNSRATRTVMTHNYKRA